MLVYNASRPKKGDLTAQAPAMDATIALEITIGFNPLVLLNMAPLKAPAAMLLVASCLPRKCPIVEFIPLYTIATTPAELPRNGPLRVTVFKTLFSRSFGGAEAGARFSPSIIPQTPPLASAER